MSGLLATMALLRSPAGRTLLRCLAIVGILFVYKYLIFVKIIVAFLVMSEIAAWMIPLVTPAQPGRSSTFLPEDASISYYDETRTEPNMAPWREQEGKQEQEMHAHLKNFPMQPERRTIVTPAANTSNASNRIGPSISNRRQQEEIDRHLQRLAMAAAAAEAAAAAPAYVMTSHYYSASMMGGYPDRIGGTPGAATFTGSNPSATQVETTDFWTRSQFPVHTAPTAATQASGNHLRYSSRGLGHSKSLPESTKMYNNEDVYPSWKN